MDNRINLHGLQFSRRLYQFLVDDVLPGTDLDPDALFKDFALLLDELSPVNEQLLQRRDQLQDQIDIWHRENRRAPVDGDAYKDFLYAIGYITETGDDFAIGTVNIDPEIASISGPQLVVPVTNARFALNAANARWGSLYDALYGTDVIPEVGGAEKTSAYNQLRGVKVIQYGRDFLDRAIPLTQGSHGDVGALTVSAAGELEVTFTRGGHGSLRNPTQFLGFRGEAGMPSALLFAHHGLHIELQLDRSDPVGAGDQAAISDILLESAITTIVDFEDSVAAVDGDDKTLVYSNWFKLIRGSLSERFTKNGALVERVLAEDRLYQAACGGTVELPGRSLLLARNVGLLMKTPAVLHADGSEIFEGLLDAFVTVLTGIHDLRGLSKYKNSSAGSLYVVKPKLHGPEEVRFVVDTFQRLEALVGLPENSVKIGIMDEERRTSVNLVECIRAARNRVFFINTGFLDRTGDEIHSSMEVGPMLRKADMKAAPWLLAYERLNVEAGIKCGFPGHAQIGKGMWPMPDRMADMMAAKIDHLRAGANTAWVPSPTAATLHAMHYHEHDVAAAQANQAAGFSKGALLDELLLIPVDPLANWSFAEIQSELDNNVQSILGYVVRWIDQGVGCSKVPDINHVGLMEDRATLRISSQHVANWLHHGICSEEQVMETLHRVAPMVDAQNAEDSAYHAMAESPDNNLAFLAAKALILQGRDQPSGYTEPLLHEFRRRAKQRKIDT